MMKINTLTLAFIAPICLMACKSNADEQVSIVSVKNEVSEQDLKLLNTLRNDASILLNRKINSKTEVARITPQRVAVRFNFPKDVISVSNIKEITNRVESNYNGWLLDDNNKGARVYCLSNNKTFEIHEPLSISQIKYDMNQESENKGIYKIVQLENEWNVRIFYYKNGNEFCSKN